MQLVVTIIYALFVDLTANIVAIFPDGIFLDTDPLLWFGNSYSWFGCIYYA